MSKHKRKPPPNIRGALEICKNQNGVFIGGDPQGLRSLSDLLLWLADINQDADSNLSDGERDHTHLYPGSQLTAQSVNAEVCRLDAKGTGEFPKQRKKFPTT